MLLKRLAFWIVYKYLMKCGLFKGIYDAKHGKADYIYGITTVMEVIAINVSERTYNNYQNIYLNNIIASEEKANV